MGKWAVTKRRCFQVFPRKNVLNCITTIRKDGSAQEEGCQPMSEKEREKGSLEWHRPASIVREEVSFSPPCNERANTWRNAEWKNRARERGGSTVGAHPSIFLSSSPERNAVQRREWSEERDWQWDEEWKELPQFFWTHSGFSLEIPHFFLSPLLFGISLFLPSYSFLVLRGTADDRKRGVQITDRLSWDREQEENIPVRRFHICLMWNYGWGRNWHQDSLSFGSHNGLSCVSTSS